MGTRPAIAAAVLIGITLFIVGFALTMHSLSEVDTAGVNSEDLSESDLSSAWDSSKNQTFLLPGLLLSMVGVIVATVVPAVTFIRHAGHGE